MWMMIAAALLLAVLALAAFGCGGSGPQAAVEDFMNAAKAKDCEKMVDLLDLDAPEFQGLGMNKEALVEACKQDAEAGGEVVSFKVLEESVDGDTATVKVEVTTKVEGQESTETSTIKLTKRDDGWKLGAGV